MGFVQNVRDNWREWIFLVIVVAVVSYIGGYVGAQQPLAWFKSGICGE